MSATKISSLDDKFRLGFVLEAFARLSWREDLFVPNSTHFMGPGDAGQFVVVSGKKYDDWEERLKLAAKQSGTSTTGKLGHLTRGFAGLTPFSVSIESKRLRFTVPKDIRSLCVGLAPKDEMRVIVCDDLFEIFPTKEISVDSFTKVIGHGIQRLRAIQDFEWSNIGKDGFNA